MLSTMTFKQLSDDNLALIREYASDKIGIHPTAALIKTLDFRVFEGIPGLVDCTEISTTDMDYFISKDGGPRRRGHRLLTFFHNQYDERNFPQHFDIDLVWDILLKNHEIESMGNEDTRSFPNGMPASDTSHGWGWLNDRAG